MRKGRITASNFGKVLKAIKRNRYPPSLMKTLLGQYATDKAAVLLNLKLLFI